MTESVVLPLPRRRAPAKKPRPPDWLADAITDERGRAIANLANAMEALRNAPELERLFAYDLMLGAAILLETVPGSDDGGTPRPVRDTDVTALQEWLQRAGLPKMGRETIHQAVDLRARERAFHPVLDYLSEIEWDGQPRVTGWLSAYLGAERTPYADGIGTMFMVAMVAGSTIRGARPTT
jgi:hypothetical protein